MFKVGDKVRSLGTRHFHGGFYPVEGTVGTIVRCEDEIDDYPEAQDYLVQWERGSTSGDDCWWAFNSDLRPVKDAAELTLTVSKDNGDYSSQTVDFPDGIVPEEVEAFFAPKSRFLNAKVLCMRDTPKYTKGRIYDVIDGNIVNCVSNYDRRIESFDDVWLTVHDLIPYEEDRFAYLYCIESYKSGEWLTEGKIYKYDLTKNRIAYDDGWVARNNSSYEDYIYYNPELAKRLVKIQVEQAECGDLIYVFEFKRSFRAEEIIYGADETITRAVSEDGRIQLKLQKEEYLIIPERKTFNGRVVCTRADAGFTAGKIYKIVGGRMIDDDGSERPITTSPLTGYDNKWLTERGFIPYVED